MPSSLTRFLRPILLVLGTAILLSPSSAAVLDKQKALAAQDWWDNRDWDWYQANIPFFECPDAELVTTYYYRWELITKHLTYGSPNSGYSFTEFIDRPFWSGTYGAISCPVGHQLYEVRWLNDPRYARDYARYWFRTPGAQPRNYGCWLADAIWAVHEVHPDAAFLTDLLPDLRRNHAAWHERQFVPEVGLFWQNGHDDGMEFNINSRQTKDILRGANGYRPGFNAYMFADALAIAKVARLAGDEASARTLETEAAAIKKALQEKLWDPKRAFFFPMSMRDETDEDGNVVQKHTLTYQSGKYAGSLHGRELHGYIPWQFNLPDPGFESAWKFLTNANYFEAPFGPVTVERHDPLFVLKNSCCWWSGQSWPYATAQTLKALANLLHHYEQDVVTRGDYVKLLHTFAVSHRKDGRPYLAEALHPDTGSFEGHDGYNHSEHYFHSSFNDLVITGLVGLKSRADETVEIDPLAPADWPWWALDDVPYHGHKISILWDRDGSRYGMGPGLQILANGKVLARSETLGKLSAELPPLAVPARPDLMNYAVNNDGDYFPRLTASFSHPQAPLTKVNDGHAWYTLHPPNRWTTAESPHPADWLEIDFGTPRPLSEIKLYFLDDAGEIRAPRSFLLESWQDTAWMPLPEQRRSPAEPTGHRANSVSFPALETSKLRVTFTHAEGARTGLSEIETWGEARHPYTPAPPPAGNVALNMKREGYPKASASFSDRYGGVPENANDGKLNFLPNPVNRWTCYGSPTPSDWLEIDFGTPREIGRVEVLLYDDRGGVQAPESYTLQTFANDEWREIAAQTKTPEVPAGGTANTVTFPPLTTAKLRVLFTHKGEARSGVTEIEVWPK